VSEYQIPAASLARLKAAYDQYLSIAQVIAEAVGVPDGVNAQLVLDRGVFVTEGANGQVVERAGIGNFEADR